MKIGVFGLGHLGLVFSAGLADLNYHVVAIDPDIDLVSKLSNREMPLLEPGLENSVSRNLDRGLLAFTSDLSEIRNLQTLWFAVDTPVGNGDFADVPSVLDAMKSVLSQMAPNSTFIYSSQVPVGTGATLEEFVRNNIESRNISIICVPENLRLGTSLENFLKADRVVIGSSDPESSRIIGEMLSPTTDDIQIMGLSSAEMTKHAINSFLAISACFANELAAISASSGADPEDVYRGMISDVRIGKKAYVRPGGPIAGGTLMRDVRFLEEIVTASGIESPLISSIWKSNHTTKHWARDLALSKSRELGKPIVALGLSYKIDSDSIRRSIAMELASDLELQGVDVFISDSRLKTMAETGFVSEHKQVDFNLLSDSFVYLVCGTDPRTSELLAKLGALDAPPVVIDAGGQLPKGDALGRIKVLRRGH